MTGTVLFDGEAFMPTDEVLTFGEEDVTLYPMGYQRQLVTLEKLISVHAPKMHPEFRARVFRWIESKNGLIGIGDGWRPNPDPVSPASSQGRSFHQDQRFASGFFGYCALDLVARNGTNRHRSPSWAEVEDGAGFGVHAFIGHDTDSATDDEPWHMQPIEIRGWQAWVNAGRPDPAPFAPEPPEDDMALIADQRRLMDTRPLPEQIDPTDPPVEVQTDHPGKALFVNVTAVETAGPGFITVWGAGNRPQTSNVNYDHAGQIIANLATVTADANGKIRFATGTSACDVIVDLQSYVG